MSPRSPEKVESVGKTSSELSDQIASLPNGFQKTSLRFLDPLLVDTFDPRIGAAVIRYYLYLAFGSSAHWFRRAAFWIDWISYRVDVPGFDSLAGALRRRFKKELRRLPGCWSVIVSDPGLSAGPKALKIGQSRQGSQHCRVLFNRTGGDHLFSSLVAG